MKKISKKLVLVMTCLMMTITVPTYAKNQTEDTAEALLKDYRYSFRPKTTPNNFLEIAIFETLSDNNVPSELPNFNLQVMEVHPFYTNDFYEKMALINSYSTKKTYVLTENAHYERPKIIFEDNKLMIKHAGRVDYKGMNATMTRMLDPSYKINVSYHKKVLSGKPWYSALNWTDTDMGRYADKSDDTVQTFSDGQFCLYVNHVNNKPMITYNERNNLRVKEGETYQDFLDNPTKYLDLMSKKKKITNYKTGKWQGIHWVWSDELLVPPFWDMVLVFTDTGVYGGNYRNTHIEQSAEKNCSYNEHQIEFIKQELDKYKNFKDKEG